MITTFIYIRFEIEVEAEKLKTQEALQPLRSELSAIEEEVFKKIENLIFPHYYNIFNGSYCIYFFTNFNLSLDKRSSGKNCFSEIVNN